MIVGQVNARFEAVVRLVLVKDNGHQFELDAVVDTGFNGALTLPADCMEALDAEWFCRDEGELADGSSALFDVHIVRVIWHDKPQVVQAELANTAPLVGMSLLEDNELQVHVTPNGRVTIIEVADGTSQDKKSK